MSYNVNKETRLGTTQELVWITYFSKHSWAAPRIQAKTGLRVCWKDKLEPRMQCCLPTSSTTRGSDSECGI